MASNNDPLQGLTIDQIDVTDPQTRKFLYDNVDLNDEETRNYFQANPVKGARGWGERALDSAKLAALEGTTNFIVRQGKDLFDYNKGMIRSNYEGALSRGELTESDIERMTDEYNRGVESMARTAIRQRMDQDPSWKPEEGFWSNLGRVSSDLIGGLGGSIGPEMILPGAFGKTVMQRIGAAMGISGGLDAALQGADIVQGVEEEFDPMRFGTSVAAGGALQGIGEGVSALARRFSPNTEAKMQDLLANGGTLEEIDALAKAENFNYDQDQLAEWINIRDQGKEVNPVVRYDEPQPSSTEMPTTQAEMEFEFNPRQMEMDFNAPDLEGRLQKEASDFRMRNAQQEPSSESLFPPREEQLELSMEAEPELPLQGGSLRQGEYDLEVESGPRRAPVDTIIEVTPRMKSVMDYSDKLTGNWKNGPEVHVYDTFEGLNDIDPYALGAYTPEGQVILNSSLIDAEAKSRGISPQQMTNTVIFHEGLGHFGLAQKFREDLDGMLGKWLDNSPQFRQAVQTWKTKNAGEYGDDTDIDLDIRAAEEVLAEMSQKGVLPKSLLNQAVNFIKATARKMGLKLNYSMQEIKTILSQSHDAVVNGLGADVRGNGFTPRYMKSSFGKGSEGPLRGKAAADDKASYDRSNVLNAYRTKDDVQDILDEVTPEKTQESFDQWIDEAGTMKNSRKIAEGLSTGTTPPELLVAEDYLLRIVNKAKELSRMAAEGRATERDIYLLGEALERASVVAGKIQEVVANAARILNVRKIEIVTDKQLSKTLRQMLSSLTPDQMNNPQKILKVAERLDKGDERAKTIAGLLRAKTELLSLPRSIMSSLDLSAPFRQGVFLVGRKDFWKNIMPMFKMFGDEANYKSMMDSIKDRPNYKLMEQSRLGITDLGGNLHAREEDFISSWAEKIPVLGRGVRASGRAYTGFLNKLRADTFDSLLGNYRDMGIEPTPEQLRGIAKYVNNATGRGDLKSFEQAAPDLAAVFFSPRLIASRINLLNPVQYAKMDPILRREAVKDLLKFGTIAGTVLGLASASGARVETDPRSSDFAKIRVGDTRYDILGGFGQYLTLGSRLMTLEKKNAAGEVKSLRRQPGEERDYGSDNIMDVALDFFTNKFSPLASLARDYVVGENPVGDPFEPTDAAVSRMVPLFFQDAYELIKAEGAVGVPMIAPALFGIGVQNYDIDLGYDVLGRDIEELQISGEDNDPISVQIRSLKEETGEDVFGPSRPPKFDGVPIEKNEWMRVIGHYTNEFLKEDTSLPEFVNGTTEEKIAIMKAARKDAYREAKAYFQEQLEGTTADEE